MVVFMRKVIFFLFFIFSLSFSQELLKTLDISYYYPKNYNNLTIFDSLRVVKLIRRTKERVDKFPIYFRGSLENRSVVLRVKFYF